MWYHLCNPKNMKNIVFTCFPIVQIVPNRVKCFMSLPFYYVLYSEMKLKNELPAANLAKIKKKKKKMYRKQCQAGLQSVRNL